MSYLDQRIINLTSGSAKRKLNGSMLSHVEYEFLGLLRDEPNIIHTEVSVITCEIPVSFYTINDTNNAFLYEIAGEFRFVFISNGNYNGNLLITEIQNKLVANGDTITVAINQTTGILTFSRPAGAWSITQSANSIIGVLGFEIGTSYNSTATAPYSIIAPYPLNLLGVKRISICSNGLPIYSYSSLSNNLSNILATVEVNEPAFGLIFYKNTTLIKSRLRLDVLDGFDIQLKDEFGNLLDFNNAPWSITLGLFITRDLNYKMVEGNSFWRGLTNLPNDAIKKDERPAEAPAAEAPPSLGDPEFELLTS